MKRSKEQAEQTRQKILQAALELFYEHGYQNTSLNQIAKTINMTRGAIYGHFKDKPNILKNLFAHHTQTEINKMEQAILAKKPWQEGKKTLIHFLENIQENDNLKLIHLIYAQKFSAQKEQAENKIIEQQHQIWRSQIERLIQAAIKAHEIPKESDPKWVYYLIEFTFAGILSNMAYYPSSDTKNLQKYACLIITQTFHNIAQGQCKCYKN